MNERISDATAEAVLRGHVPSGSPELAPVAEAVAALRAVSFEAPPRPSAVLALRLDLERAARLSTDRPHVPTAVVAQPAGGVDAEKRKTKSGTWVHSRVSDSQRRSRSEPSRRRPSASPALGRREPWAGCPPRPRRSSSRSPGSTPVASNVSETGIENSQFGQETAEEARQKAEEQRQAALENAEERRQAGLDTAEEASRTGAEHAEGAGAAGLETAGDDRRPGTAGDARTRDRRREGERRSPRAGRQQRG